jgi:hypothetical protein
MLVLGLAVTLAGCAGQHMRGSENPELDQMTFSLRFDRSDLDRLYEANVKKLMESPIMDQWEGKAQNGTPPNVAVFPIRNETSEHIRGSLDALVSKIETDLVNNTPVSVIAQESQGALISEIKRQQSSAYNPNRLAEYGKQLGAQYFITGRVYDVAERTKDARRVQYFMFLQVLDVETGTIQFQHEASLTKALIG